MNPLDDFLANPTGFGVRTLCPVKTHTCYNDFLAEHNMAAGPASVETFGAALYLEAAHKGIEMKAIAPTVRVGEHVIPVPFGGNFPITEVEEQKAMGDNFINWKGIPTRIAVACMTLKKFENQQVTSFFHDITQGNSPNFAPPKYALLVNWGSSFMPQLIQQSQLAIKYRDLLGYSEFMKQRMTVSSGVGLMEMVMKAFSPAELNAWVGGAEEVANALATVRVAQLLIWDIRAAHAIPDIIKAITYGYCKTTNYSGSEAENFFPSGRRAWNSLIASTKTAIVNSIRLHNMAEAKRQADLLEKVERGEIAPELKTEVINVQINHRVINGLRAYLGDSYDAGLVSDLAMAAKVSNPLGPAGQAIPAPQQPPRVGGVAQALPAARNPNPNPGPAFPTN